MASAHFRILIHGLLNKDTDIVPQEELKIILDIKYFVFVTKYGKDTKHTKHIARR